MVKNSNEAHGHHKIFCQPLLYIQIPNSIFLHLFFVYDDPLKMSHHLKCDPKHENYFKSRVWKTNRQEIQSDN